MSLSQDLVDFFEQLPIVPLTQIAENIDNFHDLVKLSFKSEKWRCAIGSQTRKIKRTSLNLKIDKDQCEVSTNDYSKRREGDNRAFILVRQDNYYHQNVIDGFRCVNTKIPPCSISRLEIVDAKWIGISDLLKTNCHKANFGANRLKTRDLRMFLLHWYNGISCQAFQYYTFQMSQEQVEEIDMKEVVKDLSPVPWDPKSRDRKWLVRDSVGNFMVPIDLADGYDFRLPNGKLATIHLDPETWILHICKWQFVFAIESMGEMILRCVINANQNLARDDMVPEEKLYYEDARRKDLQSLRNLREDQNLDVTDVVFMPPFISLQ